MRHTIANSMRSESKTQHENKPIEVHSKNTQSTYGRPGYVFPIRGLTRYPRIEVPDMPRTDLLDSYSQLHSDMARYQEDNKYNYVQHCS